MSNAKRPTLARQHTSRTKERKDAALDLGVSISVDGKTYTVMAGDLSSMDTMALRRATGYSFIGLMKAFRADPDVDLVAALVWLARRIKGERGLDFEDVADQIGYDSDIDLVDTPEDDPKDPEA